MIEAGYGCPIDLIAHGVPHRVLRGINTRIIMIEQLSTIFSYEFMRNALIASFWISLAAGVIGAL